MKRKNTEKLKTKKCKSSKRQSGYTVEELLKLGEENNYFELAKPLFKK